MTMTTGAGPSNRERAKAARVERRRGEILRAAAHIMYQTGYHRMSMQAVADEAGLSVGLIYQYFGGKEDVLRGVILDILHEFSEVVPEAIAGAGDDPWDRIAAGVTAFVKVIDGKREATLLSYRESQTLSKAGQAEIMRLESETLAPIRRAVDDGIASGQFRKVPSLLIEHNVKMVAHGWALKHWALSGKVSLKRYIATELELLRASITA